MTDNEKRAHDLAVSVVPTILNMYINEALNRGESEIQTDAYKEYSRLYKVFLDSLNRDFPNGK